jgi:hypothetical protein
MNRDFSTDTGDGTSLRFWLTFFCQRISARIVRCSHPKPKFSSFIQKEQMTERNIALPDMILWTGTRVALGTGIGMLISRGLSKDAKKATGLALTVVGGLTTIPLAISIMGKKNLNRPEIRSVA